MKNKTILAVGAHPDDIDFGASGTIAKWAREGSDVYYLVCTNGSKGSADPKITPKKLIAIRKKEQIEAAKVLGVKEVFFLGHEDTQLAANLNLKEEIVSYIRKIKPDILITLDPAFFYSTEFNFINHTDHREAGLAAMDAVYPLARDILTFPNAGKPHKTSEILFINFEKGNYFVDISDTIEIKIKALRKHESQFENSEEMEKKVRERARFMGKEKDYKFAECFVRIILPN